MNRILRKWGISQARNGSTATNDEAYAVEPATPKRAGKSNQTASSKKRARETTGSGACADDEDKKTEQDTPCGKKPKIETDEETLVDGNLGEN